MFLKKIQNGLWVLTKGFIISVIAIIGLMSGSFLASLLGLPKPVMPPNFTPETVLIFKLVSGTFFYILLGLFFNHLRQKKTINLLIVFWFYLIVVNVMNIIEGSFFTTMISWPYNLLTGFGESLFVAIALSFLFNNREPEASFSGLFSEWASGFNKTSLILRLIISWLSFGIIYYIVGLTIAPIVVPYYQSSAFGLKLPILQTIIILQLIRGVLILIFSLPLIALWKKGRFAFFIWFGSLLSFKDVILNILGASWLPWIIRTAHGLELTVDSFLLAGVYSVLLIHREVRNTELIKNNTN